MYDALTHLSRTSKRSILLVVDILILLAALYAAFALRFGTIYPHAVLQTAWSVFPVMAFFGLCLFCVMGLSHIKLGAYERTAVLRTAICAVGLGIACSFFSYVCGLGAPRSIPIIFSILFFAGSVSSRFMGQYFLEYLADRQASKKRVLIYGAGKAGIQLASALRQTQDVRPVVFVDDNVSLRSLMISGLSVLPSSHIGHIIEAKRIDQIILAIPSMKDQDRFELLRHLKTFGREVQSLPSFAEMIEGKGLVESLRPVSADDLLGRDKVDLDLPEVAETYAAKSVLV